MKISLCLFAALLFSACSAPVAPLPGKPPETAASDAEIETAAAVSLPAERKIMLMHYMPWYKTPDQRGSWGSHWTGHQKQHDPDQLDASGLPDIWSHYHPLIGLYDSADPDVLECQLLQMKLAGVDGVIADWYGIGQAADYPMIHEGTKRLFGKVGELEMLFSVCYEDRTVQLKVERAHLDTENVQAHLSETMRWMHENWFGEPQYVKVAGRPLLLNFGPVYVKDPALWQAALSVIEPRPLFFALHHLWQKAGADGGFTWVHAKAWEGDPGKEEVMARLNKTYHYYGKGEGTILPSATPGFKDVYANPHPWLAHREGETLRESLAVCMEGPWPMLQLVTWNDYGEGTMIEPTHEFGYLFLEVIQETRRIELGNAFPFTAEDLRLPARLLQLRRQEGRDDAALDAVAALLRDGKTRKAREVLGQLEQPLDH